MGAISRRSMRGRSRCARWPAFLALANGIAYRRRPGSYYSCDGRRLERMSPARISTIEERGRRAVRKSHLVWLAISLTPSSMPIDGSKMGQVIGASSSLFPMGEAAACDIGDTGVDDAQTRQTHGCGPRKANAIREMRCITRKGPGDTANIMRQFRVWRNSPIDAIRGVLCFEGATLRFPPRTGGFAQIPSPPDNS